MPTDEEGELPSSHELTSRSRFIPSFWPSMAPLALVQPTTYDVELSSPRLNWELEGDRLAIGSGRVCCHPGGCGRIWSAISHPISNTILTRSCRNHVQDVRRERDVSRDPSLSLYWTRLSGLMECSPSSVLNKSVIRFATTLSLHSASAIQ